MQRDRTSLLFGAESRRMPPLEKSLCGEKRDRQCRDQHHRDCGSYRPITIGEKLAPQHFADHLGIGTAEKVGDDELAHRGDEHKQRSGEHAWQ